MPAQRWNVTPKEAIELQKELRFKVQLTPLHKEPTLIAGADVSMNLYAKDGFAGFVTLSFPGLASESESVMHGEIPFPYVPGLLSFREIPLLLRSWEKLSPKPDVVIVDGVGIAHPRRLGIASHLGLLLDVPAIGCAKSVLVGTYEEPDQEPLSHAPLVDVLAQELLGYALRTKRGVKPVFVSPGHKITHEEALGIIKQCVRSHRIPEPTRAAHNAVNRHRIAASKK